mgnify:CR=1 FL=1
MTRIKLTVSYDGTDYSGWQIQDNAKTIEGCLVEALMDLVDRVAGGAKRKAIYQPFTQSNGNRAGLLRHGKQHCRGNRAERGFRQQHDDIAFSRQQP